MKDIAHHLGYIQKKVIQAARKNDNHESQINGKSNKVLGNSEEKKNFQKDSTFR